ncbi:MAG: hypothetical protein AB1491_01800 [Thermodesulfobacteriota bacterium]
MENKNFLEKIDVDTILREGLVEGKKATVMRLFRLNILFPYVMKGRAYFGIRGSLKVRIETLRRLKAGPSRSLTQETIGKAFKEVSGRDDEFIVSRLEQNIPISELIEDFLQAVRNHLDL